MGDSHFRNDGAILTGVIHESEGLLAQASMNDLMERESESPDEHLIVFARHYKLTEAWQSSQPFGSLPSRRMSAHDFISSKLQGYTRMALAAC